MLKIQKVPIVGGGTPPSPRSGASRRRIFDSYENTYFLAKILIFRCKNTEIGKSNLAALGKGIFRFEDIKLLLVLVGIKLTVL